MAPATPRLTCADLPPRNTGGLQARSPQLHRLAQHQKHLLELQQRREQKQQQEEGKEVKEERTEELHMKEEAKRREEARRVAAAQEARRRAAAADEEEEEAAARRRAEEVEERKKEEAERQRRDQLQLQLQQQQEELQQIMQWQQELEGQQGPSGAAMLLSPSSGLCTIYEALENSEEEEVKELRTVEQEERFMESDAHLERVASDDDQDSSLSSQSPPSPPPPVPPPQPDSPRTPSSRHPLDWGKKVDMVQQLINQSLLLTAEGCCCAASSSSSSSPLFLLPGGTGGTLSPLESSLWPRLLPPLTPPSSATVTAVSSYSPEVAGSAPQGEWTVVELETHH